jgi:hypothetical protein
MSHLVVMDAIISDIHPKHGLASTEEFLSLAKLNKFLEGREELLRKRVGVLLTGGSQNAITLTSSPIPTWSSRS